MNKIYLNIRFLFSFSHSALWAPRRFRNDSPLRTEQIRDKKNQYDEHGKTYVIRFFLNYVTLYQ